MDGDVVRTLALFIPLCMAASGVLVWAIRTRPANISADEAAVEGQWRRQFDYAARLEARCLLHEQEIEACHRERDQARAEAIKWKLIAEAGGQMKQDAALAAANERLADEQRKRGGNDK